ncbi:hypothetical protein ACFPRL_22250 [Pseudoclavibacter helvolus]
MSQAPPLTNFRDQTPPRAPLGAGRRRSSRKLASTRARQHAATRGPESPTARCRSPRRCRRTACPSRSP